MPLITVMSKQVLDYWVVAAIEIKRSQGLIRGKNDKADAKAIALYPFTHQHTYTPAQMPEKQLQQLKLLFTEREKILKAIALFKRTQENGNYLDKEIFAVVKKLNKQQLNHLNKALPGIDKQILQLVKQKAVLNKQNELLTSIPGIGKQRHSILLLQRALLKHLNMEANGLLCWRGTV